MSDQSPLIVPMTVEALVVNDHVRLGGGNAFYRARMQYDLLRRCGNGWLGSPDDRFTSNAEIYCPSDPEQSVTTSEYYNGVYLKWRLPEAFTHGIQDRNGGTTFLTVPNRWLVVRYNGPLGNRTPAVWIIESDYLWMDGPPSYPQKVSQVGSLYVQPNSATDNTPVAQYMGQSVALADGGDWAESGHTLHLNAMAPGNPAFALYQPTCNNVFSFVDPLNSDPPDTLSYLVVGWYSSPQDDPLANLPPGCDFTGMLQQLGWTVPASSDPAATASWSMLAGMVTGVPWQTAAAPPGGAPPQSSLAVAVGNSSVEALTALVSTQAAAQGAIIDAELLEAFQLDLIDVLDEPDGGAVLANAVHASTFQKFTGGYVWEIVDSPNTDTSIDPEELEKEQQWLTALNTAQANLDAAKRLLVSLERQLYVMWWKYVSWQWQYQGQTSIPGLDSQDVLAQQLDPTQAPSATLPNGSIAWQVAQQQNTVGELGLPTNVPSGDTPQALDASIAAYATAQGLPTNLRQLKRANAPTFCQPNDPVVLIAGAGASGIVDNPGTIECRFPSQLITGFTLVTNSGTNKVSALTPGLSIQAPDLSGISGVPWLRSTLPAGLFAEFFLLDPNNATAIAAATGSDPNDVATAMNNPNNYQGLGEYPTAAVGRWTENPWHPLLLQYQAIYYPIGYGTPDAPNWAFQNGQYTWNGSPASVLPNTPIQGIIQLTPAAVFNMESHIQAFLNNNPDLDLVVQAEFAALLSLIQAEDGGPAANDQAAAWDLLSQALNGFNSQLASNLVGLFLGPGATSPAMAALIGDADGTPPALGPIPTGTVPPTSFQPWRCGQFVFTNLALVDEWGQAVWPITTRNYTRKTLFLPPDLNSVVISNSVQFLVSGGPVITSIDPPVIAPASQNTVILNGFGFKPLDFAWISWNLPDYCASRIPNVTSATQASFLVAHVPSGLATVAFEQCGMTSNTVSQLVTLGLAITSLSPAVLQAGMAATAEVALTVQGVNFNSNTFVQWNGAPLRTDFVSNNQLTAWIPAGMTTSSGSIPITVATDKWTVSPAATLVIAHGPAIAAINPSAAAVGTTQLTFTVEGVGFTPTSVVTWNQIPLLTTFVSSLQLTASVPDTLLAQAASASIAVNAGYAVLNRTNDTLVQVPPALLQPARLDFDLVSSANDDDPLVLTPGANPVCGWILPNHIDASVMAYDRSGNALGEMSIEINASDTSTVCWTNSPTSPYSGLDQINTAIPHFGPFLWTLAQQTAAIFASFVKTVDETLWTTIPMGANFDHSLAVIIGRPLAMVRARLQFELNGPAYPDPSWQFTFSPAPSTLAGYEFAIELGNVAQLEDGLIGYFTGDDYSVLNVAYQGGDCAYLQPIGADDNYIYMPFDGTTEKFVSLLVDPRAAIHATTAILPTLALGIPAQFVDNALDAMNVTFRVNGILTDAQIPAPATDGTPPPTVLLMPVPRENNGVWTWLENEEGSWSSYPIAPNDAAARLSSLLPVLRRGMLHLSSALRNTNPRALPPARRIELFK